MKALLYAGRFLVFLILYLPVRYVLDSTPAPTWAASIGAAVFAWIVLALLERWLARSHGEGKGGAG